MAQYDLYIDVSANALVAGPNNSQVVKLPPLVEGDTPTFRIFLLARTGNPISPYTQIPTAGISLQVAIGDKIGNVTNYYTQQFTWTPSTDPSNSFYWLATLPLNTAAITTLIGAGSSAQSTLEVKYLQGSGVPTTVLQLSVTLQAAVIKNGGVVVPAGLTALSAEQAAATYLTKTITDFYLVNTNTGKKYVVFVDDNGSLECTQVI